jgi:hypothetical protein
VHKILLAHVAFILFVSGCKTESRNKSEPREVISGDGTYPGSMSWQDGEFSTHAYAFGFDSKYISDLSESGVVIDPDKHCIALVRSDTNSRKALIFAPRSACTFSTDSIVVEISNPTEILHVLPIELHSSMYEVFGSERDARKIDILRRAGLGSSFYDGLTKVGKTSSFQITELCNWPDLNCNLYVKDGAICDLVAPIGSRPPKAECVP